MNKVEVNFNPYLPELKVYINGRTVSKFSSITAYRNAPFIEWCESFFAEIHREVNDTYGLIFVGTEFEAEIMEWLSSKEPYCKSFETVAPSLNQSIFDRLSTIEKLSGENGNQLTVKLFSEDDSLSQAMLDILDENGTFVRDTDITALCGDCPLVNIEIKMVPFQDFIENGKQALNLIVTAQFPDDAFVDKYDDPNAPTFVFSIASNSGFWAKKGNSYIYSVDADSLSDYLLKIVTGYLLCGLLSEKSYQIQRGYESGSLVMTDDEYKALEKVCLTEPTYKATIPKELYRGRSFTVTIQECPEIADHQYRAESNDANVILTEGLHLKTVNAGEAEIKLFKEDSPDVLASQTIKVKEAALIERIEVFPQYKGIRESLEDVVEVKTFPENAVNAHEIQWSTSDPCIAIITDNKTILGVSCGRCELIISAGDVIGKAQIEVMPPLEDIVCPTSVVNLAVGEQAEWKYTLKPENCYERDLIKIWSSDEGVASYLGGYIVGKTPGTANLTVYTLDNRIKKTCHIVVSKKKLFK